MLNTLSYGEVFDAHSGAWLFVGSGGSLFANFSQSRSAPFFWGNKDSETLATRVLLAQNGKSKFGNTRGTYMKWTVGDTFLRNPGLCRWNICPYVQKMERILSRQLVRGSVQIFPGSRRQLTGSRKLHRPFAQAVRDSRWCARPNEGFVQQLRILEQQQGKKAACPVMGCKTYDVASTATVTTSQLQHSKFRYVIVLHPCLISVCCKYQQAILAGSLASSWHKRPSLQAVPKCLDTANA